MRRRRLPPGRSLDADREVHVLGQCGERSAGGCDSNCQTILCGFCSTRMKNGHIYAAQVFGYECERVPPGTCGTVGTRSWPRCKSLINRPTDQSPYLDSERTRKARTPARECGNPC